MIFLCQNQSWNPLVLRLKDSTVIKLLIIMNTSLMTLCKNHDLHIINGRFGDDSGVGQTTCNQ